MKIEKGLEKSLRRPSSPHAFILQPVLLCFPQWGLWAWSSCHLVRLVRTSSLLVFQSPSKAEVVPHLQLCPSCCEEHVQVPVLSVLPFPHRFLFQLSPVCILSPRLSDFPTRSLSVSGCTIFSNHLSDHPWLPLPALFSLCKAGA